jgi:serine/threonine-protein kinase
VVGDLVAERYELEELVGSGGMSRVFRAHDRLLDRQVALKILHEQYLSDEEYVERFRREARAAAQLGHPNIVTVIDRGRANGCEYIVFEYVEGENLKQLVERTGALPVRRALELGIQIGRALEFAHANGLVHRDVKPQNVLLGNGRAKVTDFGIARTVDVHGLTQTGTVLGTSDYIAPEQAQGLGASEQSDVYSLGVVLYELLTGTPPFIERRPDLPPRVAAAIERALEKDPARRFPSMADFVAELRACVDGPQDADGRDATAVIPSRDQPPRAAPAGARRRRRPGAAAVLLVCGLLAAATSAGIYFASRGGSPAPSVAGGGGPAPAAAANLKLQAVTAYDPQGDGGEHNEAAHLATDGITSTYWETEHYASQDFGGLKSGVGLVVDAGKAVKLAKLGVATDTPGFSAIVRAGASQQGPFTDVSSSQTVSGATVYTLHVSSPERYYLLWITRLASGDQAHVNEVSTGALTAPAPASAAPPPPPPPPPSPPAHGRGKGKGKSHKG